MVKLNDLANVLFEDLKNNESFFKTKKVFLPSIKLESFLKSYFLKNKDDVLMNVLFIDIKKGLFSLFKNEHNYNLANSNQIKSIIINYLNNNEIKELKEYFAEKNQVLRSIKIYDIASNLTKLFNDYDNDFYTPIGYQKDIYSYLKKELLNNNLTTLRMLYENDEILIDDEIYLFGFYKYSNLEKEIINKYDNKLIKKYEINNNEIIKDLSKGSYLVKAPNKLREIEYLHSTICNLLKDKNNTYSDFLVLSNNMTDYEMEIKRVFNQDNSNFINIPYYFNALTNYTNNTYSIINKLIEIANKGYFNRIDFVDILSNSLVKKIRNIDDVEIDSWIKAIKNLNIYRKEDWLYLKNRLLVSKISDINDSNDEVIFNDFKAIPYQSIGLNDDSIVKIIMLIDDLNEFLNLTKTPFVNETFLDSIMFEFEKWLSIKEYGIEKNSYFVKINELINFWKKNEIYNISINALFYSIVDIINKPRRNIGSLYSSGISFSTFDDNSFISAKYLFIIGGSSDNLPQLKTKNPLDERNEDINYIDEENLFDLAILNSNQVFFSYVNKNPKTLEEQYYVSNFIKPYIKKDKVFEMTLDENREFNELYTKKEFKNKIFKNNLINENKDIDNKFKEEGQEKQLSIKASKMAEYLDEPLKYMANYLFGKDYDDGIGEAFESYELNNLDKSLLLKKFVKEIILYGEVITKEERLVLENVLPHVNGSNVYEKLKNEALKFVEAIEKANEGSKIEILALKDIAIKDFNIIGDIEFVYVKNNSISKYYTIKSDKASDVDNYKLYIAALIKNVIDNKIDIVNLNNKYEFELNPNKSIDILSNIYNNMTDLKNIKFYTHSLKSEDVSSYNDIIDKTLGDSSVWNFFDYAKMIDIYNQIGYDFDNYKKQYEEFERKHLELICYLKEDKKDE